MRTIARLFMRDLVEVSRSPGSLALVLVAPLVLLLLIGNLNVRDPVLRVALVADHPVAREVKLARVVQLEAALHELASLEVIEWPGTEDALRARAVRDKVDLVVVWQNDDWRYWTPLTNSYRAQFAQTVAQDLALSLQRAASRSQQVETLDALTRELRSMPVASLAPSASAAKGAASQGPSSPTAEAIRLVDAMAKRAHDDSLVPTPLIRAWLANRLEFYFPAASPLDRSLVPGFIALIAVFLPFLLASGALVREREAGTLETLIIVARRNWVRLAAAKLLMPLVLAVLATVLLLVAARTAFGFGIKPGFGAPFGVLLVAAATSAMLGLSISTLLKSSQDAYTIAAAYLIACILITGLIYPVEQAASAVATVSYLFPLTLSAAPLENWMFQGSNAVVAPSRWAGLLLQLAGALSICAWALQRMRRRL